jgi:hypothetical protein
MLEAVQGSFGEATIQPFESIAPCLAHYRGFALEKASYGQASSLRVAGAVSRTRGLTRSLGFCMSMVGASRHSAAPGSQSVESRRHRRRALGPCLYASESELSLSAMLPSSHRAWSRLMPNPSIERTRPGKPGRASHVKR